MDLKLPVDFERLPEFRMLCGQLLSANGKPVDPKIIERAAVFIWLRLWVELAYAAQTTNQPGLMTSGGSVLFVQSLEPMFGTDVEVMEMLVKAGCLKPKGDCPLAVTEWNCERFARMNGHLAGDFVSRETKGAAASALERNRKHIERAVGDQVMLLAPEVFRVRDTSAEGIVGSGFRSLTHSEINRCMVMIKTLDNCLKISSRKKGEYTDGLIGDAWAAVEKHSPAALKDFYVWLQTHREHPAVPKRTEQVLAKFEECFQMKG